MSGSTGFVYFIQAGDDGPVKIGYSSTQEGVQKRLDSCQTGNPEKLQVRRAVAGSRSDELALHLRFAKYRLEGEWFMASVPVATEARCPDMGRFNPHRRALPWIERAFEVGRRLGFAEGQRDRVEWLRSEVERIADEMEGAVDDGDVQLAEVVAQDQLGRIRKQAAA